MPSSRDSSVWRTLAVAFGDGLAFGVALTLTNNAARIATSKTHPPSQDIRPLTDRITEIEQRIDRSRVAASLPITGAGAPMAPKVADTVLAAIEGRFSEMGGQIDRRLAELEIRMKVELEALETAGRSADGETEIRLSALRAEFAAALESQRKALDSDMRVLRSQMVELHKEFAETLSRLVDQQIEQSVTLRLQPMHEQLRETIRDETRNASESLGAAAEQMVESRLQAFRQELGGKDRQLDEMRARVENQDRNMLELLLALGQTCLQAAERIAPPAVSSPPAAGANGCSGTHIVPAVDRDVPGFARAEPRRTFWRIPAVSGVVIAASGMLALHYLVL